MSKTALNADDELRLQVHGAVASVAAGFIISVQAKDEIMQLVLADRKKHELQARIDELNSLPHRSVTALTGSVDQSVIYERLDELKQELESYE